MHQVDDQGSSKPLALRRMKTASLQHLAVNDKGDVSGAKEEYLGRVGYAVASQGVATQPVIIDMIYKDDDQCQSPEKVDFQVASGTALTHNIRYPAKSASG